MATDTPYVRAYEIHVGFGYDSDPGGIEAELAPVLGDRLVGVTTEGVPPAKAVILIDIPHRRATPTIHHEGSQLSVAEAVDRAGFVHERAVDPGPYRDVFEE